MQFPELRLLPLNLEGCWESASTVVVGDVQNITPVGIQRLKVLPWPASPTIDRVYWCQADFHARSVVKGKMPPAEKKFLWASGRPGCELHPEGQAPRGRAATRVWFLREEGNYIRPVVDGFGLYYYILYARWDDVPGDDAPKKFAQLLLTPSADGGTLRDYAQRFEAPASTACLIVGRTQCVPKIRALAQFGDPDLRRAACGFLRSQFGEKCPPLTVK